MLPFAAVLPEADAPDVAGCRHCVEQDDDAAVHPRDGRQLYRAGAQSRCGLGYVACAEHSRPVSHAAQWDGALARVLFVPHASSAQADFNARLGKIVGILQEEVAAGRLMFNAATGHLSRTRGACQFCTNALYQIGKCDYESELTSLAQVPAATGPLAAGPTARTAEDQVRAENAFHAQALGSFIAKAAASRGCGARCRWRARSWPTTRCRSAHQ